MTNFSKTTISAEAASMGNTLDMLALMSDLQKKQYDAEKAGIESEGKAAIALGQATRASMQNDADNMQSTALGYIASGSTNIGMEVLSGGIAFGRKANANSTTNTQLENVQNWETELTKKNDVGIEMREMGAEDRDTQNEIKQQLRSGQRNLKNFGDQEASQLKEAIQGARSKGMQEDLDNFQESLDKKKESISNDNSRQEQKIDRLDQRFTTIGQGVANIAQGGMNLDAAKSKRDQADQEELKTESQFVFDTMKQANQTAESLAQSTESNKRSLIDALLRGLADSNRV